MTLEPGSFSNYRKPFSGTLYRYTKNHRKPWEPSGCAGRYNGNGTKALYFGISPESAWAEIKYHMPDACKANYNLWTYPVDCVYFFDVGLFENNQEYLRGSESGGYEPTQRLRSELQGTTTAGFRYPSYPAYIGSHCGTSFCLYPDIVPIKPDGFQNANEDNQ